MKPFKKTLLILVYVASTLLSFGQNISKQYFEFIEKADSLYNAKDYKNSGIIFSEAFKANGGNASQNERYDAASAWALAGYQDSAFFQLNLIATTDGYSNYLLITSDSCLNSLHHDKRWNTLIEIIRKNKDRTMINLNKFLVEQLDSINEEQNHYSRLIGEMETKYGNDSKEYKDVRKRINENDSISLIKVKSMIDKFGWLGIDIVGEDGSDIAFLVIHHSDNATREKYLPLMKEAVKNGTAKKSDLALLEDRVLLAQGKRQIYGSQIGQDTETQLYFVRPLADPDNVDKRRAEVGLRKLADYLMFWQIKWDVEQYKKDLPTIEAKLKARQK